MFLDKLTSSNSNTSGALGHPKKLSGICQFVRWCEFKKLIGQRSFVNSLHAVDGYARVSRYCYLFDLAVQLKEREVVLHGVLGVQLAQVGGHDSASGAWHAQMERDLYFHEYTDGKAGAVLPGQYL